VGIVAGLFRTSSSALSFVGCTEMGGLLLLYRLVGGVRMLGMLLARTQDLARASLFEFLSYILMPK
jgi:hypothetical protein